MSQIGWPPPGEDDLYTVEEIRTERIVFQLRAASHEDAIARYMADGRRVPGSLASEKVVSWRHTRDGEGL